MIQSLLVTKLWLQAKLNKFMHNEKGEVNIVAIGVLIGIAVALAIIFRGYIGNLLNRMFGSIDNKVDNAIGD